jgi:hypothetical protein
MKVVYSFSVMSIAACVFIGCNSETTSSVSMDRQKSYSRLAIVCAPVGDANPSYSQMILNELQSRVFPLKFLEKVDCLPDVSVDTASKPPIVQLEDPNDYDAVVALVYSYGSGHVYLDCYMTDTMTSEQIWHYKFNAPDPAIKKRLCSQGLYVPAIIRKDFYGL